MIGRYSDLSVYREIVISRDSIKAGTGAVLIPIALGADACWGQQIHWLGTALLLVSVAINGLPIVWEALKGIFKRQLNVDELVSIAITACLITGNYLEAAVVSAIMVLGALVEEAVSDSARHAIRELMEVTPDKAVKEVDGKEKEVDVADIRKGDILVIKQGQTIAVDGQIISGAASVDESAVTGESVPVEKDKDHAVYAGSICVQGYARVRAEAVGEDSTMGKMIALVQAAEQSGTSDARMVDRYAAWFTPVILSAATLTFLITRDVSRAITVLIVGCPCSFLLAGPVTTIAAVGRAAKAGVLVKGGQYLESVARAKVFCFDKTGTITQGAPVVTHIRPQENQNPDQILKLAASVEKKSLHPLAQAIVNAAVDKNLDLPEADRIQTRTGIGISGTVDGNLVSIETAADSDADTCVMVFHDGQALGTIHFEDRPRSEAGQTIDLLKKLEIDQTVMISGDQEAPVARVARQVGIQSWFSAQKPEDKLNRLKAFKDKKLVYVGDGINDAPALKLADTGIAMGLRGSDAALETADVVLMNDDLSRLPLLVVLSRKMVSRIRLNIGLSFGLNALAVGAGSLGILTPIMGAVFHNLGSILVVSLAAALRYGKINVQTGTRAEGDILYSPGDSRLKPRSSGLDSRS